MKAGGDEDCSGSFTLRSFYMTSYMKYSCSPSGDILLLWFNYTCSPSQVCSVGQMMDQLIVFQVPGKCQVFTLKSLLITTRVNTVRCQKSETLGRV